MQDDDLNGDFLYGVPAIAQFVGLRERAVYHLAETGRLPLFKVGDLKWCGRKSTLRKHFENLEAKHADQGGER
jgi:hypothetical protein